MLAVVWGLLAPVVFLLITTVQSFYRGTGVVYSYPEERPAVARVGQCERVGPVSGDGFGYWWHCDVTVTTDDGRVTDGRTTRSKVTPEDAGREVAFREACSGDGNTECAYGRPVNRMWAVARYVLTMLKWAMAIGVLLQAIWHLRHMAWRPVADAG